MRDQSSTTRTWSWNFAAVWLLTLVVVAAMAWIGLMSGRGAGHVPAVWWANSVLLAIVLLNRRSARWPLIFAGYCGNVIAHLLLHDSLGQVFLLSLVDTGEAAFAVLAVQWNWTFRTAQLERGPDTNDRGLDLMDRGRLLRFVLFGVLLGPLLAACAAALILRWLLGAEMITAFRWFPPSALGMAIVAPLLLSLARKETMDLFAPQRIARTLLALGLLAVTTLGIFSRGNFPLLFLLFPPLLYLVVELGVGGGALGLCIVAAIASVYTVAGHGVMAHVQVPLEQRILILQMFLATAVLSADVVGLVLGDLKRSVNIAEQAHARLNDALETLEEIARVDAVTRIANRRYFDEVLQKEWSRAIRESSRISIILLDVDHFKNYNDLYGHLAGDDCLRRIADLAGSALHRTGDTLARFGGEEFALVLPNTDSAGAECIATQILASIREAAIPHEASSNHRLTVSLGCATASPRLADPASEIVSAADRALYQAKRSGRDRVVVSPG